MTNPSVDQINLLAVAGTYLDHFAQKAITQLQAVNVVPLLVESPSLVVHPTSVGWTTRPVKTEACSRAEAAEMPLAQHDSRSGQLV